MVSAAFTTQSASTMASPIRETSTITPKTLVSTPRSMPFLTSAGSARPVVGRRQRLDLGYQLGGGRQAGERRGDRPHVRVGGGGPLGAAPTPADGGGSSHGPVIEHLFHGAGARPDRRPVGRALVVRV